ncbi:MAG TPA: YajQ family cyclic di-GMP-binding protein [Gammaproteobacteria bacterium]|nr:YajQ family cyclic di-GMP-binding protein [Gammaproteobacteria bacterium]
MPSFDVVSEVDLHEVRNAVDQAVRELRTRFDFRGVDANIELAEQSILISAPEEFQLGQLKDILRDKMTARNVDSRALTPGNVEGAGKLKRQTFALAQGIDKDNARQITKILKESKLKIQSQINGDKVRVTGKKRDDLQAAMAALKESDIAMPLQYNNFRD